MTTTAEQRAARASRLGFAEGAALGRSGGVLVRIDGPAVYVTAFEMGYRIERDRLEADGSKEVR